MLSEVDRAVEEGQASVALVDAAWQRIRQHLKDEKQRIFQEIRQYPPPIPACDVHFNTLLEERATILQESRQLAQIRQQNLTAEEQLQLLDAFMRSSYHVSAELEEEIRQEVGPLFAGG